LWTNLKPSELNGIFIANSKLTCNFSADDDTDGISTFNRKNNKITNDFAIMKFTYFKSLAGASSNDTNSLINNPLNYTSGNSTVWARVENSNKCTSISEMKFVSTTQIPASFSRTIALCDDYIDAVKNDTDGISTLTSR
jgi:hypothetical protein